MEKSFDIVALGEVMLRLSPPHREKLEKSLVLEKNAAGAELNVAAGAAQLGLSTTVITKLPGHALTRFVLAQARAAGVRDDGVLLDSAPGARMGVYYYEGASAPQRPSVIYDRAGACINTLLPDEVSPKLVESARLFHTTGITLGLGGQARATAVELIRRFKQAGAMISFDVNYRANLWDDQAARSVIEPLLPLVDVLFISEESFRRMFRRTGTLTEIMEAFAQRYSIATIATTSRTVVSPTRHLFTSTVYDAPARRFYTQPPYEIDVVDRIGSGDAFVSGALFGLLRYGDARKAMRYGNAMAAAKCTVVGDLSCTTLDQIDRLIARHEADDGGEMDR